MALMLHADPELALPAEWEVLRAHFQSMAADVHVALRGSMKRLVRLLAPDQFDPHFDDDEVDFHADHRTTRRIVIARVDPLTGELSCQAPE
jgi:LmbE family N-acetylglucosaminyl deacetylase